MFKIQISAGVSFGRATQSPSSPVTGTSADYPLCKTSGAGLNQNAATGTRVHWGVELASQNHPGEAKQIIQAFENPPLCRILGTF